LVVGEVKLGLIVFTAFDDGVDEVCLTALRDLFANELPDLGGVLLCGAASDDGSSAWWHLVDNGDFEVTVEGEGEGARNGGGGHGENVGIASGAV
jgi:hypothetical protein